MALYRQFLKHRVHRAALNLSLRSFVPEHLLAPHHLDRNLPHPARDTNRLPALPLLLNIILT